MSSANVEGMLREGVNALKAGRRDEARALLLRAVELDQYNEEAWLWLSGVLESFEDQRTCLENVLSINPGNDRARQGLDYINKQLGIAPAAPAPQPQSSGLATSIEWGAPVESPITPRSAPSGEPTPDILDNWVTTLNLPVVAGKAAAAPIASPFGDVDLSDDIFSAGPFRADDPAPPRASGGAGKGREATFAAPPAERTPRRQRRNEAGSRSPVAVSSDKPLFEPMFPGIPADMPATRLPGTVESTPILITLAILLLIAGNIALAVMFMMGFFA
ncbi:MAG: bacterial transcriptional activator domain-containing protein [Chloroflexota bacterium]|nr:bacterial transcriptional activator domain-containing protein [Chloroflexota bacterium]